MTVKAVCAITNLSRDSTDHTHFVAGVSYCALVDASIQGVHYIYDLDPSTLGSTLVGDIQTEMKTFLTGEGVSFGLLDSVRLLPGTL